MYIFKLKLSEKARGYCMYVFIVFYETVTKSLQQLIYTVR